MEQRENGIKQTVLSQQELQYIQIGADIRRRQIRISTELTQLKQGQFFTETMKEYHEKTFALIMQEMTGKIKEKRLPQQAHSQVNSLLEQAKNAEDAGNLTLSAFYYAQVAKLQEDADLDYSNALELAKKSVDKRKQISTFHFSSSDLLPEAIIIGIEKRMNEKITVPESKMVAKAIVAKPQNMRLLTDYALVLSERERENFINVFPENERLKISALIDKELSGVLNQKDFNEESELAQKNILMNRIEQQLGAMIESPTEEGLNTWIVKTLSESLSLLNDEEHKNKIILKTIGEKGLKIEKDKTAHMRKISFAARIIKTLIDNDIAKGATVGMKFLAKKEIPPHLFTYFCRKLMKEKYLTEHLEKHLNEPDNFPFLRHLLTRYPSLFNTVIDTVSQVKNYPLVTHQEEIFQAIEDLDTLTPIIFERYRFADQTERKELGIKIKALKKQFFLNIPIKNILQNHDREILSEMVYAAYRPIGISFEQTKLLLERIDDQTDDLKKYIFPLNGYDFDLQKEQVYSLKTNERLDMLLLASYKELFSHGSVVENTDISETAACLKKIAKAGFTLQEKEIVHILNLIVNDEMIVDFINKYPTIASETSFNYLNELKEIFGIYMKDNYIHRLNNFLSAHPAVLESLSKTLANPQRREMLKRNLAKIDADSDIQWERLSNEKTHIALVLSRLITHKVFTPIIRTIDANLRKFETTSGKQAGNQSALLLKAYISKNAGSFFAKASAGICTAEDIGLFEKSGHFHINIVENDEKVVGNNQAYIITEGNKKSLVLRGFNPRSDFISKIDVENYCEKVISIGRQFQEDNTLHKLYITEQGSWHALSNREEVARYLTKKYCKEKNKTPYTLQVASNHSIHTLYEI